MSNTNTTSTFTSVMEGSTTKPCCTFNVSVDFTNGFGKVVLERTFDEGVTWKTIETFTESTESIGTCAGSVVHRFSCVEFYSGTIVCTISQ